MENTTFAFFALFALIYIAFGLSGILKLEMPVPSNSRHNEYKIHGTLAFVLGVPILLWGLVLGIFAIQGVQGIKRSVIEFLITALKVDQNGMLGIIIIITFALFILLGVLGLFFGR
jgi:hypothetical protein